MQTYFLAVLGDKGFQVSVRPNKTLIVSPKEAITDDIREYVRANKAAILAELMSHTAESIMQLSESIKTFLEGKPLPISIKPGESIIDVIEFAAATARDFLSSSEVLKKNAGDRLKALGFIKVEDKATDKEETLSINQIFGG